MTDDQAWISMVPQAELNLLHHALRMLAQHPTTGPEQQAESQSLADALWDQHVRLVAP